MAPRDFVDGIRCIEVGRINSYAVYIAYLSMIVRGLSFLVLTWTTVVLLGGFVSDLSKKDFWSLTVITLVQPAGIFDYLLKENANDIVTSLFGSLVSLITLECKGKGVKETILSFRRKRFDVLSVFKVLDAISLRYPLAVLYVLGMCISTAVSLWRLVQHDYNDSEGVENLKPGLKILYSLAVAQGVVFGYKTICELMPRTILANQVAHFYSLDTELVSDYLEKTLTGCMKDPSFAIGRNLVTYAADLMESKLRNEHLSGVRILGTIMLHGNFRRSGQADLMKQLLTGWASFSHMVQRLVETFGPRSPYNTEIRVHAARIMANVAGRIRLEQFPSGMILEYISFLLHPYAYEEYRWQTEGHERDSHYLPKEYEQGWLLEGEELMHLYWHEQRPTQRGGLTASAESDKALMVQGMRILQKLIMHEDNCRVIGNTDVLSRAMAPLVSDQLHRDHDDEWCSVAEELLELMSRLLASPGEIRADMQRNISTNKEIVISTLKNILGCPKCEVLLKRQAVVMLLYLSEDTSSIVVSGNSSSRIFKWILLHIFLMEDKCFGKMCGSIHWAKKSSEIRILAGERLLLYSQTEGSTMSMVQQSASGVIMGDLTRAIVDDMDNTFRLYAVQILEHLCVLYTKDDVFLEELKKAILEVMRRKVLKEILGWGSAPPGHDIEGGGGLSPSHVHQLNNTCHENQNGQPHNGTKLREAFVSLCCAVDRCWMYKDQVVTRQLNNIAADVSSAERGRCRMGTTFRLLVWRAHYRLEEEKEKKEKEKEKKDKRANLCVGYFFK